MKTPDYKESTLREHFARLSGFTLGDYEGYWADQIVIYSVWTDYFFNKNRAQVLRVEDDFVLIRYWTENEPKSIREVSIPLGSLTYNHYIR